MSATTAAAVKTLIESLGLGLSAYRDRAPEQGTTLPYVTIHEDISLVPDRDGDFGDPSAVHTGEELVQVDLWQQYRNLTTNAITESFTLPDALSRGLHGARLTTSPTRVYGVKHVNRIRLPDADENVVRHVYTVAVMRRI